jgi:phosphoribosylaminoimidazolecarboxamide formyltransferase / IMP cyclohydrolase
MTATRIVPIRRALLSVSDKTGLTELASALVKAGAQLLSTGGSAKTIAAAGLPVQEVADYTGFPEMLDGRVKTLHPKVHGGLLGVRDNADHQAAMAAHDIAPIDLIVLNLYPFEAMVARGAAFDDCIENIDIGGPAMIRSAAKNHADVTVLVDPADYQSVLDEIATHGGTTLATRTRLAAKAYATTGAYDAMIANWFSRAVLNEAFPEQLLVRAKRHDIVRYGENPHQGAAVYAAPGTPTGLLAACQVQGKALSYNNYNDTDAAWALVREFDAATPTVAIIKHANPCGVAQGSSIAEAYARAFACDTTSAFGGIIAANQPLDEAAAKAITEIFTEVVIAPDADAAALAVFAGKKNLRLLLTGAQTATNPGLTLRSIAGGYLVQQEDASLIDAAGLKVVTKRTPTQTEMADLLFAFTVAKHVKSNAIVYAKAGQTVGIGAGQMSRVDSSRIAAWKAGEAGLDARGSAVASDAFFPFADGLLAAAEAGATAVIQPGGSMRDQDVIDAADAKGLAMVFAGQRHFRH